MSTTTRLLAAAGTIALLAAITPPAGAEPAGDPYLDQVVTIAGFDLVGDEDHEDGVSGDGGPATAARLGRQRVTIDVGPDGTVYAADASSSRLRMVDKSGVITAVPGTVLPPTDENSGFAPVAVAASADGVVHVAGQELVYRLVNGVPVVLAGGGELTHEDGGTGGDGGPGTAADLGAPVDIDVDAAGNVYVADDYRQRIRRIDPNGIITTVAGGGTAAAADGGPATGAALGGVQSVAVDSTGAIYFTERDQPVVRKVAPDGTLSTVTDQVVGTTARLAVDDRNTVYVLDDSGVRTIDEDVTLAPVGPLVRASLDIAIGPDGNVYLADYRKILMLVRNGKPAPGVVPTKAGPPPTWAGQEPGTVVTLAGNGESAPQPRPPSAFDPIARSVAAGTASTGGPTYVSDTANHRVLAIGRDGRRTVFAGTGKEGGAGDGGPASKAQLTEPRALAAGADGTVYVAEHDRIRQIAPDGTTSVRAMVAANDITVDGAGVLYATIDRTVVRIDPAGTTTAVGGGGDGLPSAESAGRPATEAGFYHLGAVAVDANGIVYFVDTHLAAIFAIERDGVLRTVIGSAEFSASKGGFSGDGGAATAGEVNNVGDLAAGQDGSLYFTDTFNNRIRRIDPSGVVATVAGTGAGGDDGDGGPAAKAPFTEPRGLAVDADGTISVSNRDTDRLRRIDPAGTVTSVTGLDGPAGPRTGDATKAVLGTTDGGSLDAAVAPDGTLYVTGFWHTRTVDRDGQIAELRPTFTALDGRSIDAGPDGTLYSDSSGSLTRWFPNGASTILVSRDHVDTPVKDGSPALHTSLQVRQFAVGPRGELYVSGSHTIFQVRNGKLHRVAGTGAAPDDPVSDLAVGPDGALYASTEQRVLTIDDAGTVTTFAGGGSYSADDNGDGGPADEASLGLASSIAVSPAGIVYLGTSDGVRAVDEDGEINTIVPAAEDPSDIAVDRHGNLLYTTDTQVKAVVRADEVYLSGFAWSALLWGAAAVVVLGFGGWWLLRRRAATTASVHSGPSEDNQSSTDPDSGSEQS